MEEPSGPPGAQWFRGYKSPQAHRNFVLAGCGIVMLFLAAQVLMPLQLGQFAWPPWQSGGVWPANVHARTVVLWRGELWYVAGKATIFGNADDRGGNRLIRVGANGPQMVCLLAPGPAWLLPQKDSLWIFATDGVSQYDEKNFHPVSTDKMPAPASRPFLLDGLPAVMHEQAGEWHAAVLQGGRWTDNTTVHVGGAKDSDVAPDALLPVAIGDKAYVFCNKSDAVYCREGDAAGPGGAFPAGWELVCPAQGAWTAAAVGGSPAAFAVNPQKGGFGGDIVGFSRGPSGWRQTFSFLAGLAPHTLGVAPDSEEGGFRLLYQALPWSVNVVRAREAGLPAARRYGELIPADPVKALKMFISPAVSCILLLALVLAFTRLMAVCREDRYLPRAASFAQRFAPNRAEAPPGPEIRFASLGRRAVACLIDFFILLCPLLAGAAIMVAVLPPAEDHANVFALMAATLLIVGGVIWAAGGFLLFCYTLGRWGRTPGKWALGIRALGTDLRPFGFSRAVLRMLFLFVEGFLLDFAVAILLIAFTVNWQRLGDLVARTIVIREPPQPAGAGSQ